MTNALTISPNQLTVAGEHFIVPAQIADAGDAASEKFIEFFTATIRNPNTRKAYHHDVMNFFAWCSRRRLPELLDIRPTHIAAYIEQLARDRAPTTVKQHLSAIRMLFDFLVVGQIMSMNPAHSVRGPRHSTQKGKTPVLSADEARTLLGSIDTDTVVGLRDRAVIATMLYTFARVEATVGMNVSDYFSQGKRWWLRLHEKGGKHHEMPAHHKLEDYLDAYIAAAGLAGQKKQPLFLTARGKTGSLTRTRFSRQDAWKMIRRRAKDARISTRVGNHSLRATGITNYLENGGTLEKAQQMAAHSSTRTTKLYDRRNDQVTLDEVEKIAI